MTLATLLLAEPASAASATFVSGWGAAPARGKAYPAADFTCRQIARMTIMGSAVRIHLSNAL
ncbi:MAG: hypothetical protein ABW022_16005, partial [Actinoplanes sp.]